MCHTLSVYCGSACVSMNWHIKCIALSKKFARGWVESFEKVSVLPEAIDLSNLDRLEGCFRSKDVNKRASWSSN